jgi:hypothetical protein
MYMQYYLFILYMQAIRTNWCLYEGNRMKIAKTPAILDLASFQMGAKGLVRTAEVSGAVTISAVSR